MYRCLRWARRRSSSIPIGEEIDGELIEDHRSLSDQTSLSLAFSLSLSLRIGLIPSRAEDKSPSEKRTERRRGGISLSLALSLVHWSRAVRVCRSINSHSLSLHLPRQSFVHCHNARRAVVVAVAAALVLLFDEWRLWLLSRQSASLPTDSC